MTAEGETLILKKIFSRDSFDKKMANKAGEWFLLTTKFYKNTNYTDILAPKKRNPEGKAAIQLEGTAANKQ